MEHNTYEILAPHAISTRVAAAMMRPKGRW